MIGSTALALALVAPHWDPRADAWHQLLSEMTMIDVGIEVNTMLIQQMVTCGVSVSVAKMSYRTHFALKERFLLVGLSGTCGSHHWQGLDWSQGVLLDAFVEGMTGLNRLAIQNASASGSCKGLRMQTTGWSMNVPWCLIYHLNFRWKYPAWEPLTRGSLLGQDCIWMLGCRWWYPPGVHHGQTRTVLKPTVTGSSLWGSTLRCSLVIFASQVTTTWSLRSGFDGVFF